MLRNLKGHISSVRTMAVSEQRLFASDKKQTFVMFSAGGRAQIKVWKIMVSTETNEKELGASDSKASSGNLMPSIDTNLMPEDYKDLKNKCVHEKEETKSCVKGPCHIESNYELLASHMLRDPLNRKSKSWQRRVENMSPETRFMDLTAFHGRLVDSSLPSSVHFVGAACSDAVVR